MFQDQPHKAEAINSQSNNQSTAVQYGKRHKKRSKIKWSSKDNQDSKFLGDILKITAICLKSENRYTITDNNKRNNT